MAGKGDLLPVSAFPVDGTWPLGTTRWEKRRIADEVPIWDPNVCIQCNKCALVCPHAAIRAKVYEPQCARGRAGGVPDLRLQGGRVQGLEVHDPGRAGGLHRLQPVRRGLPGEGQVEPAAQGDQHDTAAGSGRRAPDDARAQRSVLEVERDNYDFFLSIPDPPRDRIKLADVKGSQFLLPLFEYSGACNGCGETPYLKLLTQLFGDRLLIANATGCSSIYGGNLPDHALHGQPRGPRARLVQLAVRGQRRVRPRLPPEPRRRSPAQARTLLHAAGRTRSAIRWSARSSKPTRQTEAGIDAQRQRVAALAQKLAGIARPAAPAADDCSPTTWSRRASGSSAATAGRTTSASAGSTTCCRCDRKVNVLVLDTEVYSNTGGQASKSTPHRRRRQVRRRRQGARRRRTWA